MPVASSTQRNWPAGLIFQKHVVAFGSQPQVDGAVLQSHAAHPQKQPILDFRVKSMFFEARVWVHREIERISQLPHVR